VTAALAARRTGDESDFAFELSHDLMFLSLSLGSRAGAGAGPRLSALPARCISAGQLPYRGRSDIARGYYVSG
jgi:hypothetical protein